MGIPWLPQNPGIDLQQLTDAEIAVVAGFSALTDPGADRIVFWDESSGASGAFAFLTAGSGLDITGTTLTGTGATKALDNLASVAINTALILGTSDGAALGSATKMWSDLFLASGAIIDFNGDITLTHSLDTLTLGGGNLALGANSLTMTGSLGATGARLTKGWFTDLEVTNAIAGSITGNAATVTTNANLTGHVTSVGNAAVLGSFTIAQLNTAISDANAYYNGGTDVAVADGGTGLSAIAALSLIVANSADTYVALTPGAGNSIRINAGGTAWEAYTPGAAGASTALDNLASVAINTALILGTSDAAALGSATKMWSDLFVASGAVINFNNGDVTITHTADVLTIAGGNLIISTPGTAAGSVAVIDGTQTLSNKTLTAPKFADLGFIADANGNELFILDTVTSAVNEITFANAATGANPNFIASGGDANVGIDFTLKGTGTFNIKGNATQAGQLRLYEDTDVGTNFTAFKAGTQASDITYTLPTAVGVAGTYLKDVAGDGVLSWATAGGTSSVTIIPIKVGITQGEAVSVQLNDNATIYLGQVIVPFTITVNKISFKTGATIAVEGTADLTLYAEDGQSQLFSVTTATIDAINTIRTTTVSSVVVAAGVYYIGINTNTTADFTALFYDSATATPWGTSVSIMSDVASEPVIEGTSDITASTPRATFSPTSGIASSGVAEGTDKTLIFRLDN